MSISEPEEERSSRDRGLFEQAPISLWEEDYSPIKYYFDRLRHEGVTDLAVYLDAHPETVADCMRMIRVLDVNRQTVRLFKAGSKEYLLKNLDAVFRGEMSRHFREELLDMWNGLLYYSREGVNYTLAGEPVHVLLHWSVLEGHEEDLSRVLVSLEDITARKQAEAELRASEQHFRGVFEYAPISLWEEDYSALKSHLGQLRAGGVEDLNAYLDEHPVELDACMDLIRVMDVNRRTLDLFNACTKQELLEHLDDIFRDEMRAHFRQELLAIWGGRSSFEGEGINYSLSGEPIYIYLRWSAFPDSEESLAHVLVSIEDITIRKRAEDYLKYLGTHDVLTGLYNRAYFEEERSRLEREDIEPVSIALIDVDGLKQVNDTLGHEAGDTILRRTGEVLRAAFGVKDLVARIGGDEFAVLMPECNLEEAEQAMQRLESLVAMNNMFYRGPALSLSHGAAASRAGVSLAVTQRVADDRMYAQKRQRRGSLPGTGSQS